MKKHYYKLLILMLTIFVSDAWSQTEKPEIKPGYRIDLVDNKEVLIEFDTDQILDNVLILIVDNSGNTLFLDSQKNFKGIYKCSVDMSMYSKGDYFVNIKSDKEQKQAKFSIK